MTGLRIVATTSAVELDSEGKQLLYTPRKCSAGITRVACCAKRTNEVQAQKERQNGICVNAFV